MFDPITPEEFFAIGEIRRSPVIGRHLIDLEDSEEILVRIFAVDGRSGWNTIHKNTPHAQLEAVIEYDLNLAKSLYPRLYNVHVTLTHLLAHELGHIWAGFKSWKTTGNPPSEDLSNAESLAWENAMRGVGPYRLVHGKEH